MAAAVPKTAVFGAHGHAGRFLFAAYRKIHPDTVGTDWKARDGLLQFDLAEPNISKLDLVRKGMTWAAIPAFIRDYNVCETQKDYTAKRNVDGILSLCRQLTDMKIKVAFFSSDGVFDGRKGNYKETDTPVPINEYARQKLRVEQGVMEMTKGSCLILRLARIVGVEAGDGTILDQMAQSLTHSQPILAARDQIFSTILVDDVPGILMRLQSSGEHGIFHIAAAGAKPRLEIAQMMVDALGMPRGLVKSVSLDEMKDGIARPKNLSLRCERLERLGGPALTPLSACVERVAENTIMKRKSNG